ncbi:MAG: alpha/beta fold hydrolase [Phycicoccus sp.]
MTLTPEFDAVFRHGKVFGADGGVTHYVIGGQGPALLLVHGWMGTWYSWRKVMPLLAEHFTVIAPDCRGYGDSHKPYSGYDGRTIKNELRTVLHSLDMKDVTVVGHDIGALVAVLYAAEHRDEVRGLGYLDEPLVGYNLDQFTAFTPDNPFVYWWFSFNSQPHVPALLWEGKEAQMVDYFLTAMTGDPRAIGAEDKAEYVRTLRSPGGLHGSFGWYRDSLTTGAQIRESTATRITCPVLAMNGQFGHPGVTEQMALVADDVVGRTISGCGHMLAEEYPEVVADAIRDRFGE